MPIGSLADGGGGAMAQGKGEGGWPQGRCRGKSYSRWARQRSAIVSCWRCFCARGCRGYM
ncbi:hypothetical protein N4G58_14250 [Edwardsiella piscicida]|nr:hypothetical protein N4G58_14250 [Edwardsiella piscicida]